MATEVIMPQLGESVVDGTVGRWLIDVGDSINEFDPLVEIESDKVTTEMPSPAGGVLLKVYVAEGETVDAGVIIALIGQPDEATPDAPAPASASTKSAPVAAPAPVAVAVSTGNVAAPVKPSSNGGGPRISPVVARIAAEHNINIMQISGTGREGRVTKKDILAFIEGGAVAVSAPATDVPPWEQPGSGDLFKPTDGPPPGLAPAVAPAVSAPTAKPAPSDHVHKAPAAVGLPGEIIPHSKMRKLIAEHMVFSKLQTAPHVTTVFEVDLSAISAHRKANKSDFAARGVNLTFTAYFIAALAHALRKHPMVNSQWTDDGVHLYQDVNIGMAVAIDEGLIVPVIKQSDELSLQGLARQINDLAIRARSNKLSPDEVRGGTFTITNHGVSGSLFATPIINQPQTGIFGVGAIQKRVVVTDDDAIAVRLMVYISLTFDHRVLDGAIADFFVAEVKSTLENWA